MSTTTRLILSSALASVMAAGLVKLFPALGA